MPLGNYYFTNLRTSEILLFYNLQLFYWHFLEILWLFIFLVFYNSYKLTLEREMNREGNGIHLASRGRYKREEFIKLSDARETRDGWIPGTYLSLTFSRHLLNNNLWRSGCNVIGNPGIANRPDNRNTLQKRNGLAVRCKREVLTVSISLSGEYVKTREE